MRELEENNKPDNVLRIQGKKKQAPNEPGGERAALFKL